MSEYNPKIASAQRTIRSAIHTALALFLGLISLAPAALAASPVTIVIGDTLDPKEVTVTPGTTVTWRNDHDERHRMRSQSGPVEFDSGNLDPGQAFSMSFDVEGTYSYLDERDNENTGYFGTVIVSSGAGQPADPPGDADGSITVDVVDRLYRPSSLTIDPGTTVIWGNIDDRPHTVTARDRSFDSGIFDTGGSFTLSFDTPGTYEYFCILHPDMVGTVTVAGADGAPPPPPPEPDPDPAPPPVPVEGDVAIFDNGYTPTSLSIPPGSTVTWANTGALPHTVTGGDFDSGLLMAGDTYSHTLNTAGTYTYICTIHPEMQAVILVSNDLTTTPPPEPVEPPEPGGGVSSPQPSGDLRIVDNAFQPKTKTIAVGNTVSWANTGSLPHTVTDRAGNFDSGLLMSGDTYSRQFNTAGTFNYICALHPEMTATLIVTQADGTAPPPEELAGSAGSVSTFVEGPSDVEIVDNDYRPASIEVGVGSTITWVNTGALPHTVTARSGSFDSGLLMSGDSFRRTFEDAGTFEYYCTIHPEMVAVMTVVEGVAPVGVSDPSLDSADAHRGTDPSTQTDTQASEGAEMVIVEVDIIDLDYDPRNLTVTEGTTVIWSNVGDLPHTVTTNGIFDSGIMASGDSFSWTFAKSGTYEYLCTLHPGMSGRVIVEAGGEVGSVDDVVTAGVSSAGGSLEADGGTSNLSTIALSVALGLGALIGLGALGKAVLMLREDISHR